VDSETDEATITGSLTTDENGNGTFVLATSGADEKFYRIEVLP